MSGLAGRVCHDIAKEVQFLTTSFSLSQGCLAHILHRTKYFPRLSSTFYWVEQISPSASDAACRTISEVGVGDVVFFCLHSWRLELCSSEEKQTCKQ